MNHCRSIAGRWSSMTWSSLMMIALVNYRIVHTKIAQGCVFSQLILSCPETQTIEVSSVLLGDSSCYGGTNCCIGDNDCTAAPSQDHVQHVGRSCNGRQSCRIDAIQQNMYCSWWYQNNNNDFERITYKCIRGPRPGDDSSEKNVTSNVESENNVTINVGDNNESYDAPHDYLPTVFIVVCAIILVIIITLVVIIVKRKKWKTMKSMNSVEMSPVVNTHNEATFNNENGAACHNQNSNCASSVRNNEKQGQIQTDTGINLPRNQEPPVYSVPKGADARAYSLAGEPEGNFYYDPKSEEDANVYCDIETKEPAYQTPKPMKPSVYSVERATTADPGTVTANATYENTCSTVQGSGPTRETTNQEIYQEAKEFDEGLYEDAEPRIGAELKKEIPVNLLKPASKSASSASSRLASEVYAQVRKPVKFYENSIKAVVGQDGEATPDSPDPTYEPMTPLENIYANEAAVGTGSVAETGSSYCDMSSPKARISDDGTQTVIENELYSH